MSKPLFKPTALYNTDLYRTREQDHGLESQIDYDFIKQAAPAIEVRQAGRDSIEYSKYQPNCRYLTFGRNR